MKKQYFWIIFACILIVYISGLFIDVMDVDASQYASISREMLENGSYLQVKERGQNYLDKPPLIFWLSASSFKFFGISNFSYKLPSFLFSLLALFSVYRLAKLYYSESTARFGVLITASCQAFFIMNNDCRTDTVLTGALMFAIYNLAAYLKNGGMVNFASGFAGIGLAMLAKGPIGLIVPVIALGSDLLIKREWKKIWRPEWILGILFVCLMLVPMCIGLYQQYGFKGLEFYFWKQSFGRITGDNDFVKQLTSDDYVNDPFFFYHTFLWAFLPWPVLFLISLFFKVKGLFLQRFQAGQDQEYITVAGFILTFAMMSMSNYKLPHYIFMVFPFAGIITAEFFEREGTSGTKWVFPFHVFVSAGLWIVIFYLIAVSFAGNSLTLILFFLLMVLCFWVVFKSSTTIRLPLMLLFTIISANFFLNTHVYPRLLRYQVENEIGRIIKREKVPIEKIRSFINQGHSLDFYSEKIIPVFPVTDSTWTGKRFNSKDYLIIKQDQLNELRKGNTPFSIVYSGGRFGVSMVTGDFLNPQTRNQTLEPIYLVRIN